MPSRTNRAIIAVAGGRKTQSVVEGALADPTRRVVVTTYTNQNLAELRERITAIAGGVLPGNIHVTTWFEFLLRHGIRPYQVHVFNRIGVVRGLNFVGERPRFVRKEDAASYYLDRNGDVYRNGVSDLVCRANDLSQGKVVRRLERLYSHIYVDELQDLTGYDLEVLDLLFDSTIEVTIVGDPRQHTFSTNTSPKNKKYRGAGMLTWLKERTAVCVQEERNDSYRCNQAICEFASSIFPSMPPLASRNGLRTGHDGVFEVPEREVADYVSTWRPKILRHSKRARCLGLPAMNIGVAKGTTFDRVLIFPTKPMRDYLAHRDPSKLKAPESLYVAVTRARFSVAFVTG